MYFFIYETNFNVIKLHLLNYYFKLVLFIFKHPTILLFYLSVLIILFLIYTL